MIAISPNVLHLQLPQLFGKITEQELILGLRQKCQHKFSLLYKMYAPALLGIISRIVKSEVIAEDVLQETFVKLWNSIEGYDASRGKFFTWMAATARHSAIDHLRSRASLNSGKNSNLEDAVAELNHSHLSMPNPNTIGLKQLTSFLPDSERTILELVYFQGFSHSEVAEELNIPLGTVKTRLRRAISTLRAFF